MPTARHATGRSGSVRSTTSRNRSTRSPYQRGSRRSSRRLVRRCSQADDEAKPLSSPNGALPRRSAGGIELRYRLHAVGIDSEETVEAGDLEDLRDAAVGADEREPPLVHAQALDPADKDAERRRVD